MRVHVGVCAQDGSEPLRELTEAEKASIEAARLGRTDGPTNRTVGGGSSYSKYRVSARLLCHSYYQPDWLPDVSWL